MTTSYKIKSLIENLKKGEIAPVYFLQGNEMYYIEHLVTYIEEHVLPPAQKNLNFRICYGNEHALHEILTYARSMPMLGSRQVIIVKEAQKIHELSLAQGQKKLLKYIEAPNTRTTLVFAYNHGTIQNKTFAQGFVGTKSVLFSTPKVHESHISHWIAQYVTQRGYTISEKATLMLQELLGTNLQLLSNELQKIMIHLQAKGTIKESLVAAHVGMQRDFNTFELQRAIGAKEVAKAFQIVDYFSQNAKKHPAIPVVALLTTFFLKLLQLHTLPSMHVRAQAAAIQIPPYFMQEYQTAAKKHSLTAVIHHLRALHHADLQLKGIDTPSMQGSDVLKELLARMFSFK